MNFSSIKNLSSIYLYLISVVCFVIANVIREYNIILYYILLVLGVGFFVIGFTKRLKKQ
jgi:hypothetical protein